MNANQIAQLINLTAKSHTDSGLSSDALIELTAALIKLSIREGVHEETLAALREISLREYEAPANG